MKKRSENGSIAIFVLITLLFYMGFLLVLYSANMNKLQASAEKLKSVKAIYEVNINNKDEVYHRKMLQSDTAEPTINNLPSKVITNITANSDEYATYGTIGGSTEYVVQGQKFSSLQALVNYLETNNHYGKMDVEVNAYGNNGKVTRETKNIEFIKGIKVENEAQLKTALETSANSYIQAAADIVCSQVKGMASASHTLDVNNHTISYTEQDDDFTFLTIGSGSTLTILDSSSEKNGKLLGRISEDDTQNSGADRNNSIHTIENQGTLIIQGGTVAVDYLQDLDNVRDSIHVRGTATAIKNTGTVTVDGGAIVATIETRAISYGATRNSEATGVGIENTGTINLTSGSISVTADAYMDRQGIIFGETKAYAYGVNNYSGTVNKDNSFTITVAATAHEKDKANTKTTTYKETQDQAEIKNN